MTFSLIKAISSVKATPPPQLSLRCEGDKQSAAGTRHPPTAPTGRHHSGIKEILLRQSKSVLIQSGVTPQGTSLGLQGKKDALLPPQSHTAKPASLRTELRGKYSNMLQSHVPRARPWATNAEGLQLFVRSCPSEARLPGCSSLPHPPQPTVRPRAGRRLLSAQTARGRGRSTAWGAVRGEAGLRERRTAPS